MICGGSHDCKRSDSWTLASLPLKQEAGCEVEGIHALLLWPGPPSPTCCPRRLSQSSRFPEIHAWTNRCRLWCLQLLAGLSDCLHHARTKTEGSNCSVEITERTLNLHRSSWCLGLWFDRSVSDSNASGHCYSTRESFAESPWFTMPCQWCPTLRFGTPSLSPRQDSKLSRTHKPGRAPLRSLSLCLRFVRAMAPAGS